MNKPGSSLDHTNTQEIQREHWPSFLAEFTRENRGAHARLEIVGADTETGDQVEIEDRPFDGISADLKDGEDSVWITFSSTAADHLSRGIIDAEAIYLLPSTESGGVTLEVTAGDGTRTILYLSNPLGFSLPQGGSRISPK